MTSRVQIGIKTTGEGSNYDGPIKVIGAGFGRTGTASMKKALEKLLNAPCYHMAEVIERDHVDKWQAVSDGRSRDFKTIFSGYAATVDNPSCLFFKEIWDEFPDAKIVLTIRDSPDKWFESARETILCMAIAGPYMNLFQRVFMNCSPFFRRFARMNKTCWDDVFFNNGFDRDNCVRQYNRWIEHVKATVPPERLLVFNVKEGYGPLCRFLEVAEPDEPFPFENETTSFRKVITFMTVSGALICAGSAALVAAGGYLVYSMSRK